MDKKKEKKKLANAKTKVAKGKSSKKSKDAAKKMAKQAKIAKQGQMTAKKEMVKKKKIEATKKKKKEAAARKVAAKGAKEQQILARKEAAKQKKIEAMKKKQDALARKKEAKLKKLADRKAKADAEKARAAERKAKAAARKAPKRVEEQYIRTGVPGFDVIFEEGYGIPNGASVLIEGGPGSGKTIFCLATSIELCRRGKKCLYMSFEEPEEKLVDHMHKFGWDAQGLIKKGLLKVKRFDAIDVSRSVEALLSAAKKELLIEVDPVFFPKDFKPDFVVIDSLTSIASAFSGQQSRFRIYMEQLFRYLEKNKITNFLIREVSTPTHIGATYKEEGEAVSFLSDGIIVIYNVIYDTGARGSAIEILKMRGSAFKKKIVEMYISSGVGVTVDSDKILKKDSQIGFKLT